MTILHFGTMPDGAPVEAVEIAGGGLTARFLTWGAVLQDLRLAGHAPALVLGFPDLPDYLAHSRYFGATAGRCANRIAQGEATIDGETFRFDRNFRGGHTLHGGADGCGKRLWDLADHDASSARLEIVLEDGHMGFPGRLAISARFHLSGDGGLDIEYAARTDKPTLCNIAHHSYFALDDSGTVLDHDLRVEADTYTPVDEDLIPTGEVAPVAGTRFDFRRARPIRREDGSGPVIDQNFCTAGERGPLRPVARLSSRASGVRMDVATTEPGLQVFDGAPLDVPVPGLDGRVMGSFAGIALEPQVWPDAPNHPDFPSAILRPGETYRQHTRFVFRKEAD